MPRRKYGHMVHALPVPKPKEKCRYCKLGWKCPVHGSDEEVQETSMSRRDIKLKAKGKKVGKGKGRKKKKK